MSAASEFKHAAQVLDDIALLHRMAAGTLSRMSERPPGNLLKHRRRALPSVSVAVAAQLLGVSPTTVSFGMAVTGTIIITTLLLFYLARTQWRWSLWRVLLVGGPILALEGLFLAANLTKLVHGAWLPLLIGVAIFTVFTTWQRGRQLVTARRDAAEGPLRAFVDDLHEQRLPVQRVPDTAVFLNRGRTTAPLAMRSNVKHNHVLHERVVIVAVETVQVPVVRPEELTDVDDLGYTDDGITNVAISVGYMQRADVPNVLAAIPDEAFESPIDFKNASYFLSTIDIEMGDGDQRTAERGSGMPRWRRRLSSPSQPSRQTPPNTSTSRATVQ